MPITITLPPPHQNIGLGVPVQLATSIATPGPTPLTWQFGVYTDTDFTQTAFFQSVTNQSASTSFILAQGERPWFFGYTAVPAVTDTVHIRARLFADDGTLLDTGTLNAPWTKDAEAQLLTVQPTAEATLNPTQSQQLTDSERRTRVLGEPNALVVETPSGPATLTLADLFSRNTLDRLTLDEVTNGPTCAAVRANFSFFYYGVIVRVTTIDPELEPRTPDAQWYFPDLAVLRIFRGADLQYRRGIHTPTFLTEQAWEFQWNIRNVLDVLGVPPDNTLAVDWRPGCCGQVFFLKWP
jgi:hypothetical protein